MNRKAFVLLPAILLLVASVSGCTSIPGLESFCIPGFGTCGQTVEYANDVLVISTLNAIPQTISTGQQIRLSAWILNNGGETVPQKDFGSYGESANNLITVKLYDTCEGLFSKITVNCPNSQGNQEEEKTWCQISSILPKQTIPVSWTLVANDKDKIPLETSCNLKVSVEYPYQTKSITSVTFVDYTEYQRMLNENKFSTITSYITEGYGPIKPYLTVENTQPIPVENKQYASGQKPTFQMAFQVKNQGSGFLSNFFQGSQVNIPGDHIKIESNTGSGSDDYNLGGYVSEAVEGKDIQLIGKESPKQYFTTPVPSDNKIEKQATYYVTSSIDYMYEFRKEIKVTIKPPAIGG